MTGTVSPLEAKFLQVSTSTAEFSSILQLIDSSLYLFPSLEAATDEGLTMFQDILGKCEIGPEARKIYIF